MQTLNLRQIEVFRAVMIAGSISGASKLLLISQPAVSRMLSHAEARIGFQLFERHKGRLFPSPEARRLFHDVESVYRDVQRVNTTLYDIVQQRQGMLRIVSSPSLGHWLVPEAIGAFHRSHPEVRIHLECLPHTVLRDRLLDRQADVGISLFPIDHPNLVVDPLSEIGLRVICPAEDPLTSIERDRLPAMLATSPMVGYPPGTPFYGLMRPAFERIGVPFRPLLEVDSPYHACTFVRNGTGFSMVDEISLRASDTSAVAVLPLLQTERLRMSLVHLGLEPLAQLTRAFVAALEATLVRNALVPVP
ncbi:LysR family transcriptional regulator [Pseudomonas matsuisoli]|uniref:LysR family transcriptional regulator n=1 Tax=Pseudomonas matsuisoli TaxID=1515666 RepID=A0A917UWC7_9PSED|nr:LysR family transcriptional regulator [Pseudomonas matsuisoli]GGJ89542.1 LysR family transcriptional regulator [Pseudomonas matsuisoli]